MLKYALIFLFAWPAGLCADTEMAERAIERMTSLDMENWYYTRKLVSLRGTRIDRHEPSLPREKHWQLLSLDGYPATDEELQDYAREQNGHVPSQEDQGKTTGEQVREILEPGSLAEKTGADAAGWYSFRLKSPNGRKQAAWSQMRGELKLAEHQGEPFVERLKLWNTKPFYPAFGVRFRSVMVELSFKTHGADILPFSFDAQFEGRAWLIKEINEELHFRFSDFIRYPVDPVSSQKEIELGPKS
jgi:hypothetical protein